MSYRTTTKNRERAGRAQAALDAYQTMLEEGKGPNTQTLQLLIHDILHWLAQHPEISLGDDDRTRVALNGISAAYVAACGDFRVEAIHKSVADDAK